MFVVGFRYATCLDNPLYDVGEYETQTAEKVSWMQCLLFLIMPCLYQLL